MNTLGDLTRYTLALRCRLCGRASDFPVATIPAPPETPLEAVLARLRCSRCSARGGHNLRLIWASSETPFQRLAGRVPDP